jgi:two-component system alkaline phosphatase synthesis response regulator PhoP
VKGGAQPPRKVLAVVEERHVLRLIEVNLERQGYKVRCALNFSQVLEEVAWEKPDLIFIEMKSGRLDGFTTLKTLKRNPGTKDIPIIGIALGATDAEVFRGWRKKPGLFHGLLFFEFIWDDEEDDKDETVQ